MMDHLFHGQYFLHFKTPPRLDREAAQNMAEDLLPICNRKISDLLKQFDLVGEIRDRDKASVDALVEQGEVNPDVEYLYRLMYAYRYQETFLIQRWLKYWLRLYHYAGGGTQEEDELDVERAKETPIEELYAGELHEMHGRLEGLCPFHEENSPSFNIYPEDNSFYCFGCHEHGDVLDFVMRYENLNFPQAVRRLT